MANYDFRWRYGRKGDFFLSVGVLSVDLVELRSLRGKTGYQFFIYLGNSREGEWRNFYNLSLDEAKKIVECELRDLLDEMFAGRRRHA